jgi:hypothetical protein
LITIEAKAPNSCFQIIPCQAVMQACMHFERLMLESDSPQIAGDPSSLPRQALTLRNWAEISVAAAPAAQNGI